ncbi:SAV_915 family protein [Streptomyces sp. NPDC002125]
MNDNPCTEEPDPLDPHRAGTLLVPVRQGPGGCCARLFRTPLGVRTAVAFTEEGQLTRTLGQQQPWIRLSEPAVRALVAPLGVVDLTVDPFLAAPGPGEASVARRGGRTACEPRRTHRPARGSRAVEPLGAGATPPLSSATTS